MKKKTIFILLCFLLIFSSLVLGQETPSDSSNDTELETILEKCADYCEKIRSLALYFVCNERIVEQQFVAGRKYETTLREEILNDGTHLKKSIRWFPGREVNRYVYDYQLIRKPYTNKVMEKRILISENYEKKHVKNAELKTRFHH